MHTHAKNVMFREERRRLEGFIPPMLNKLHSFARPNTASANVSQTIRYHPDVFSAKVAGLPNRLN